MPAYAPPHLRRQHEQAEPALEPEPLRTAAPASSGHAAAGGAPAPPWVPGEKRRRHLLVLDINHVRHCLSLPSHCLSSRLSTRVLLAVRRSDTVFRYSFTVFRCLSPRFCCLHLGAALPAGERQPAGRRHRRQTPPTGGSATIRISSCRTPPLDSVPPPAPKQLRVSS